MRPNPELDQHLYESFEDVVIDISTIQDTNTRRVLQYYYNVAHMHVQNFNQSINHTKVKKFYFCIIDDDSFNAYATRHNDYDIVAINVGTILEIHSYFDQVLKNGIFPEIKNGNRVDLHTYLSQTALNYIILHEMAHNFNGHNDYESNIHGIFIFDMLFKKTKKYQEQLDYKTLEMDADAFAATKTFFPIVRQLDNLVNQTLISITKEPLDLLRYWVFSVHSFYLFFQKEIVKPKEMVYDLYFPRRVRQALNLGVARTIIEKECPDKITLFNQIEKEMIPLAESAFNRAFSTIDIDEKELLSLKSVKVDDHKKEVFENWNLLHDKLIPYSRLELAPKNNDKS